MAVLFIDESKDKRYLFAVSVVNESDLGRLRKQLKGLVKPGQRSLHFSGEKDSRRKKILSELVHLGIRAKILHSDESIELEARRHCIEQVVEFASSIDASLIIFERDDSLFAFDEKFLKRHLKEQELLGVIGFSHAYKHEDPLLWTADAIAWCQNRGGDWIRRSAELIYAE